MAILTPPVISKLPLGLIRFLGLQSGGAYPQTLNTGLQTVFETLDILTANHAETITASVLAVAATGISPVTFLQVPNGQVWYVRAVSSMVTAGAGESWVGQLLYTPFGLGGINTGHPITLVHSVAANQNIAIGSLQHNINAGIFWGPGDLPSINTIALTGTIDFLLVMKILRFQI